MVIFACVLLLILIVIINLLYSNSTDDNQWKKIRKHADGSWREDHNDGSFTIYDKRGAITVSKTYEGCERYIDGHICSTADDMTRWYVKKGLSEGLERRLNEIEYQLNRSNANIGDDLLAEWKIRYDQYRQLCIRNGIWNRVIDDRTAFVPTKYQEEKEKEKFKQIEQLHAEWKQRMIENRIILDYLEKCPRKHSLKSIMINKLSGRNPEKKKQILAIYKRLKAADIIGEKQNSDNEIETRIIIRRKKGDKTISVLPASTYDPNRFTNIRMADIYKVDYTVQAPLNLNRETNTCNFESMTSGDIYSTSLERCTCPAYNKGRVCKHMLALAMHLGYYHRDNAKQ